MSKFSIIIPTYNRASLVTRAVKSVLKQYFNDWELIIIDDGSDDGTKETLEEYLKDERVTYKYQNRSGVSAARNKGLELASGEYIIFLDSDDELLENLLHSLISIPHTKYDLVFWNTKKISGELIHIWKPTKLDIIYRNIVGSFLSGSVCYKKSLLEEVKGFDEKLEFGENYELGMRLTHHQELKTYILPEIHLIYHVNSKSRARNDPGAKLKSLIYLLNKHITIYQTDKYSYSRLLYQIGYLNERLGRKKEALQKFEEASKVAPRYLKPLIKKFLLKFKRFSS
ncbi:glycosyltransferase family A protein [Gramella sp. KN1008]|uniref:glycosyltransferase family 2 protein n=1 Tax=Gramella sp. KN1008 TaxID=2529298 RepID=UPI00104006D8|nr:glycosyltransferase family A protein [Gramella sp. KN1008]TBW25601.1 glycosyltransferase family 2 protein [Gramella sp. KN1008]